MKNIFNKNYLNKEDVIFISDSINLNRYCNEFNLQYFNSLDFSVTDFDDNFDENLKIKPLVITIKCIVDHKYKEEHKEKFLLTVKNNQLQIQKDNQIFNSLTEVAKYVTDTFETTLKLFYPEISEQIDVKYVAEKVAIFTIDD
jgi:hypothetical protein